MLLLITGSGDGTSDMLCTRLGERVFRLNYDMFYEYRIKYSPDSWEIKNPTGHSISSSSLRTAFWWKAFNFFNEEVDSLLREEMKYICRELYNWSRLKASLRGNPPDFHNSCGKLNILAIAQKIFTTPKTLVIGGEGQVLPRFADQIVAKSLSSGASDSKKVLFTTAVDVEELNAKYPWYLQEKIASSADVTVLICGDQLFAFSRSRAALKGLDWRAEQDFDIQSEEWVPFEMTEDQIRDVRSFASRLDVSWGRIDFMLADGDLIFLEFNANGQFLFLDYFNKYGLHDAFVRYLQG